MSTIETIADDFDRADGPLGTTPVGDAEWEIIHGVWEVLNNRARTTTSHNNNPMAVVETLSSNVDLSLDISSNGGDCIYFRVVDHDNWWRVRMRRWTTTSTSTTNIYSYTYRYSWEQASNDSSGDSSHRHGVQNKCGLPTSSDNLSHRHSVGSWTFSHTHTPTNISSTGTVCDTKTTTTTSTNRRLYLERCINGSVSSRGSYSTSPSSVQVRCLDEHIQVRTNGNSTVRIETTDSTHQNATKHGMGRGTTSSTGTALDNFLVEFEPDQAPQVQLLSPVGNFGPEETEFEAEWTYQSIYNYPQEQWEIKVFEQQQGIDPEQSIPIAQDSGNNENTSTTLTISTQPLTSYVVYFRAFDGFNWSDWTISSFNVTGNPPLAPTVEAYNDPVNAKVDIYFIVNLSTDPSVLNPTQLTLEVRDEGSGWTAFRDIHVEEGEETAFTIADYELETGVRRYYRAIARYEDILESEYSNEVFGQIDISDWWIKDLHNPENNMKLDVFAAGNELVIHTKEDQSEFRGLGSDDPIIIADSAVRSDQFDVEFQFLRREDWETFKRIRRSQRTILLQSPFGMQWYCRIGSEVSHRLNNSEDFYMRTPVTVKQVARPIIDV